MKKTLILGAILAGAIGAYAQGTVLFSDGVTGFTMHIYGPQASGLAVNGNNATTDVPAGSTVYDAGSAVGGSSAGLGLGNGLNVSVELYGLTGAGDDISTLLPLSGYVGHAGTKSAAAAGLFVNTGTGGGIPNTTGGTATVALAAWFNGGGAYTSLTAAQAAGQAWGESGAVTLTDLGGLGSPPSTPPPIGVQSFSIQSSVPEPSTIALGIMGASAFIMRRRMSK